MKEIPTRHESGIWHSWNRDFRSLSVKDKALMIVIGVSVGIISIVVPGLGIVKASVNSYSSPEVDIKPCQPPINLQQIRSGATAGSILGDVASRGLAIQVFLTNGTYYQELLDQERSMRLLYNADIQMEFKSSIRSLTEGSFEKDTQGKCRVVLNYP